MQPSPYLRAHNYVFAIVCISLMCVFDSSPWVCEKAAVWWESSGRFVSTALLLIAAECVSRRGCRPAACLLCCHSPLMLPTETRSTRIILKYAAQNVYLPPYVHKIILMGFQTPPWLLKEESNYMRGQTIPDLDPDVTRPKHTPGLVQFWFGWLIFTGRMRKHLCSTQTQASVPVNSHLFNWRDRCSRLRKHNLLTSSSITFMALMSSVYLDVIIVCTMYGRVIQVTIQMVGNSPVASVFCIFMVFCFFFSSPEVIASARRASSSPTRLSQ